MKPEYTLHKLPEGFILTSNEGIEIGNQVYPKTENIYGGNQISTCLSFGKGCWSEHIITELTGEEGYHPAHLLKVVAQQGQIDFSRLSEEEQKEIGWFDVEKLGEDATNLRILRHEMRNQVARQYYEGYLEGFQKAQELLSDRMSTLEDMFNCFRAGMEYEKEGGILQPYTQGYIYSLLHSKSWLVEIETESVHTDHVEGGFEYFPKFTNGKIKILRLL